MPLNAVASSSSLQQQQQQHPQLQQHHQNGRNSQPRSGGGSEGGLPSPSFVGGQQSTTNGSMRRASGPQQVVPLSHRWIVPLPNPAHAEKHRSLCKDVLEFANKTIAINPNQPPMDGDSVDKTFQNGQKLSAIFLSGRFWIDLQGVDLVLMAGLFVASALTIETGGADFMGPLKKATEQAVPLGTVATWTQQVSNLQEWAGLVSRGAIGQNVREITLYPWATVNYPVLYNLMFGPSGPFPCPTPSPPSVPSKRQNMPPPAARRDSGGIPPSRINSNGSTSNGVLSPSLDGSARRSPLASNGSGPQVPESSSVAATATHGFKGVPKRTTCLACITHRTVCDLLVVCSQCVDRFTTAVENLSSTDEPPSGIGCEYPSPTEKEIIIISSSPPHVSRPNPTLNGNGGRPESNLNSRSSSASNSAVVPSHPPTASVPNAGSSSGWTSQEIPRRVVGSFQHINEPTLSQIPGTTSHFTVSHPANLPPLTQRPPRTPLVYRPSQQGQMLPPPQPPRTGMPQSLQDQAAAVQRASQVQSRQQAEARRILAAQQQQRNQARPPPSQPQQNQQRNYTVHPCCGGFAHQPNCSMNPERLLEQKQRSEAEQRHQQQQRLMAGGGGGGSIGMEGYGMGAPQTPAARLISEEEEERNTLEFEFEEWVRHCGKETGYIFTSNVQDKPPNPDAESTLLPLSAAPSRVLEILLGSKCPEMATEEAIKSKLDPLLEREKETNEEPGWTV